MILLRLISWPYLRKHLLRTVLTIAGILLGVAVFVGMHTANQSVLFAFNQTVNQIAGATQLQVTAGEPGFNETFLERVQSLPEVRVAVPVIEAVVQTPYAGQGNILILGVDMTGDRSLRDYTLESGDREIVDDPLVFLAQPDSLILTNTFASKNGLTAGSKIALDTMEGPKQFTVRGIMQQGGLTSAFGGNLAIMDVYAAQKMFGRARNIDRIDIAVNEGSAVADVQQKLQSLLGAGFQVDAPSARGQQFEALSRVYAITANITSLFALFIGMFIIFNTFSIAVSQRRGEIGILRALGAEQRQIRTLFLAESAVVGFAGSLAGVACGVLIARGMAAQLGAYLGEIYGVAQRADELSADPRLLGFALAMGTATSVIAAVIPARAAARVDPVQALQKGRYQVLSAGESRNRRVAAAIAAVAAVCSIVFGADNPVAFYAGYMMAVLAALLLTPAMALWIARALRPLLRRVRPVEGTLAADSLIQAPRRTSATVAALMLSLGLVIALGGMAKASYASIERWLNSALDPELFVTTSQSITNRSYRFPGSMFPAMRQIEGIREVQRVRSARVLVGGKPVMLVAVDVESVARHTNLDPISGDRDQMYPRAARGEGVVISDNFAILRGYKVGDVLTIPAPGGDLALPVLGIVTDYSDQQGSFLIDLSLYQKYWRDYTLDILRVYLRPGVDAAVVKDRILKRFSSERRLFVLTNQELKAYILRLTDQWFGITYIQIAVAVLVALLGIVNTLTVSITDRRRELGVLQAVGALRNQVRRTIWLEAVSIGLVGLTLGLALGAVLLYYSLEIGRRDLAGIRLTYEYPFGIALALLPVICIVAILSALGPAEKAVRGSLVEALEYE